MGDPIFIICAIIALVLLGICALVYVRKNISQANVEKSREEAQIIIE